MQFTFKPIIRLKRYSRGLLVAVLFIPSAFAQTSAPFFLPGLSQENGVPASSPELNNSTPLTIPQQNPPPLTMPAAREADNQSAQPLTTDNGLFLPMSPRTPAKQDNLTPTPQEPLPLSPQNEALVNPQTNQQPQNNYLQNDTGQPPQDQQLYFAQGADLIKPPAPIVMWKDITPPVANNQYQLLIDPASIVPSPEHPRWRQATVQAKIRPDHYLQWKLTFSCKANAVRYNEIETITQGVSVQENRQFIYFLPITNEQNQQWLRYAYNAACDE